MGLNRQHAVDIAKKLDAETRQGTKHLIVAVKHGDIELGRYNIRRGRRTDHSYVAAQLGLSYSETAALAECTFSKEDFLAKHGIEADLTGDELVH